MRKLQSIDSGNAVAIATAATALSLPPGAYGLVPEYWNARGAAVPEFELEVWAPAALALTLAKLYGATLHPLAFSDITTVPTVVKATLAMGGVTTHMDNTIRAKVAGFGGNDITLALVQSASAPDIGAMTVIGKAYTFTFKDNTTSQGDLNTAITASADLEVATVGTTATKLRTVGEVLSATHLSGGSASMHATAHGLVTGDGPILQTAGTSFPTGLNGTTEYYAIKSTNDIYWLAASLTDAMSGIKVDFSSAGVGTQKTTAESTTQRVTWQTHDGLLGLAGDGAVSLTSQVGYRKRVPHSPRVFAYALVGSIDTGTLSAAVYPIVDRD